MKKFLMLTVTAIFLFGLTSSADALLLMVGDNDGYGYGHAVVADGANLPTSSDPVNNWVFDNRSAAELAATDGSQFTDYEPYAPRNFTFNFTPFSASTVATFEFDVSGIQTASWGVSSLKLDGVDFSSYVSTLEQGTFGSDVISFSVSSALLADGQLAVNFVGGNNDHIAFDYFSLNIEAVPEPSTLLLLGSGLVGLGYVRRRFKR